MTLLTFLSLLSGLIAAIIFARGFLLSTNQIEKMSSATWDGVTESKAMREWLIQNRNEAKLGLLFLVISFIIQVLVQIDFSLVLKFG